MTQSNGWRAKPIRLRLDQQRQRRAAQVRKLTAERVPGSEHTPDELLALHRALKADFYRRHPEVTP